MANGLLVIISSGEEAKEKALTGMMYAVNAKKNKWIENVNLIFFGPSEKMVANAENESRLNKLLKMAIDLGISPMACRAVSENEDLTPKLEGLGFSVDYVGTIISSFIKKDYQVLTF